MRGKQVQLVSNLRQAGITPAHAGKTGGTMTAQEASGDHPRACGENTIFVFDLDC